MNKTVLLYVVGVVVILGVVWAEISYPKSTVVNNTFGVATSSSGTTFNTAKVAAVTMAPTSITSTSTSILNGDATDRVVLDAFISCSGVTTVYGSGPQSTGVATWQWTAATSSTAAPTASIASNALAAMQVTVATSSTEAYTSTSTYTNVFARRWNSGSYMVFQTNATSSGAACVPGLHYITA